MLLYSGAERLIAFVEIYMIKRLFSCKGCDYILVIWHARVNWKASIWHVLCI